MRQTKRKLLAKPSNLKLLTNYYPWKLVFSLMCVFLHSYRPWAASGGPWAPFLHMCPSFPPQKQVDLSPLMLSSQKMDQKAAFWAPILKSQSHWVMSFENIWTLKLDYLPAGDIFLLINPLGAAARRRKDLVLGHCCRCVPPSNGERASEVPFKRQRRTEKLTLMHPWKELQRWAVTDSTSRASPLDSRWGWGPKGKAVPGKPPGAWKCHLQPSLQPHTCTSLLTWSQTVCSSPVVLQICPKSRGRTLKPHDLDSGCSFLQLNTLSGKSCSYLVVGHTLRFRYQLCAAHLAVTVCK